MCASNRDISVCRFPDRISERRQADHARTAVGLYASPSPMSSARMQPNPADWRSPRTQSNMNCTPSRWCGRSHRVSIGSTSMGSPEAPSGGLHSTRGSPGGGPPSCRQAGSRLRGSPRRHFRNVHCRVTRMRQNTPRMLMSRPALSSPDAWKSIHKKKAQCLTSGTRLPSSRGSGSVLWAKAVLNSPPPHGRGT